VTFLLWVWSFLKRVPWQAWAVVALVAAVWWYGHSRYNAGWEAHQRAQEAAEAKADAKAATVAKRAQERAQKAGKAIRERTEEVADEVQREMDSVGCDQPIPVSVRDDLADAARRAREAMPAGTNSDP
jgi:type VI protein secretion system component VasK